MQKDPTSMVFGEDVSLAETRQSGETTLTPLPLAGIIRRSLPVHDGARRSIRLGTGLQYSAVRRR